MERFYLLIVKKMTITKRVMILLDYSILEEGKSE